MYLKDKSIFLRSSASAIPNNLSCYQYEKDCQFAVIHKNTVNVLRTENNEEQTSYEISARDPIKNLVLQAKWCVVDETLLLVVASQEGVQVCDNEGSIVHWHAFSNQEDTLNVDTFARGISLVGKYLFVGTHEGSILAFRIKPLNLIGREQPLTLHFHKSPITHLYSASDRLISADQNGCVCVWKYENDTIIKIYDFESFGFTCTSVALWRDMVLSGFSNGSLRVLSLDPYYLCSEVVAHARYITAVDVAASGLALSASEDSFIRIWKLSNDSKQKSIEFKFSINISDSQIYGACFLTDDASKIYATSYDSEEIVCYKLKEDV